MKFELLNIDVEDKENEKIYEFEKEVKEYIAKADKFINKDTTIDSKIKNYKNILGDITKSKYNISVEGIGLCNVEKTYDYDYNSLLKGFYICIEDINIKKLVMNKEKNIHREYMVINNKGSKIFKLVKEELIEDKLLTTIEYDSKLRLTKYSIYEDNVLKDRDIYEYTDNIDGSFTVVQKKQISEDIEPIFVSKIYIDSKSRVYRMDTVTGSSKRIIYDEDKKIQEEYYQDDILICIIRYEAYIDNNEDIDSVSISLIKDIYNKDIVIKSIIIEEIEKKKSNKNGKLVYFRNTKYHNGVKLYEKTTSIEHKSKSDGGRIEKQTFSLIDNSLDTPKDIKEENVIEFDKEGKKTLIVTVRPNKDTLFTVMEYDENGSSVTENDDIHMEVSSFEDDPNTIKDFKSSEKYKAKTLYDKFNSFMNDSIQQL